MSTTQPIDLASQYDPKAVEGEMLDKWNAARAYRADPTAGGDPYVIVIPPPNVTAALHMGHALNNTIQDILIRHHRMLGDNTVWMPGTDHAGIATQTVVDKRLQAENQPALKDYKKLEAKGEGGRDKFIEKVQAWKDEYEAVITNQLKTMGCSCDWDRQRFTMDDVCAAAVREAFFQLFKDGLIYRGKRLVNWDPITQTALADDEVEMETVDGHFWYMKYPVVEMVGNSGNTGVPAISTDIPDTPVYRETGEYVTVATTRPETMLGDTAVAVNPDDPDRARFIGKHVRLPIVNRIIPVIGDDYVVKPDPDASDDKAKFASGFLKVTPAHDPNDWEIGQRHDLPVINVMAPDASISRDHGWPAEEWEARSDSPKASSLKPQASPFVHDLLGMDRYEAREAIVTWFREQGLLEEVRPYTHTVGHSYRSHVPVEPYLSDQWYVKVTDERLAGAALQAMNESQRTADSKRAGTNEHPPVSRRPRGGAPNAPDTERAGTSPAANDDIAPELTFHPPRYAKTFQHWHENIRDWCISRQLWWGHRIPVWHKRVMLTEDNWTDELLRWGWDAYLQRQWSGSVVRIVRSDGTEVDPAVDPLMPITADAEGEYDIYICTRSEDDAAGLASHGFVQDPDVLDTWFSSALWPISTMGWPAPGRFPDQIPEGNALLKKWNPGTVLCTAREIITLWVSRMVMFNCYFRGCLPFRDVFIHAMIQDGEGQKMSKSLGNGVDPLDIIHSHGSDAMRFTLASMTTQTQDVRMPVDMICPHTGEMFEPKMFTNKAGYRVARPIQDCPSDKSKKMVSSYGVASGEASPTADMPAARNTSSKFDYGRNFANKLWNAARFALTSIAEAEEPDGPTKATRSPVDRWILSRAARTVHAADKALGDYDFHNYANTLYQFVWNDVCDWYIEAIKPVIRKPEGVRSRQVLATVLDVSLRLLHPAMPFVTEKLYETLHAVCPKRGVDGLDPAESDPLATAMWPTADRAVIDMDAEEQFERLKTVVQMIREARSSTNIPPKQVVEISAKMDADVAEQIANYRGVLQTLANVKVIGFGPDRTKPDGAAVVVRPLAEVFLHDQLDADAEKTRLSKRREEVSKSIKALEGRLNNKGYTEKAPAHLVRQTRDQLADAKAELEKLEAELKALG